MKTKELTYSQAVSELDDILQYLEQNEEVNMETISTKVKRASELLVFCRKQLTETDKELEKIIANLDI